MADQPTRTTSRILLARGGPWPRSVLPIALPDAERMPAIDLDLGSVVVRGVAPARTAATLWLPAPPEAPPAAGTCPPSAPLQSSVSTVVIDLPGVGDPGVEAIARTASLLPQPTRDAPARYALGLRATHLRGGRKHLAALTAVRRFAEEWDLGVAIDLTGAFDPQWEAEAAVVRLGRHLVLLRVRSGAVAPSPVDRARVARRAIQAGIERSPSLAISIEPQVPWWRPFDAGARWRDWLEAEQRLRRWFAPPMPDGSSRPDRRRSPMSRQPYPPA